MRNVAVLRIERALRPHTRVEIEHGLDMLFMVRFSGGQGGFPLAPMPPSSAWWTHGDFEASWSGLVREVEGMLRAEPLQGTSSAALVGVDLDRCAGVVIGGISVYEERAGAVRVCIDQTLGARLGDAHPAEPWLRRVALASLTPRGVEGELGASRFLVGQGTLILASEPLHWQAGWAPSWPAGVIAACDLERSGPDLALAVVYPHKA